MQSLVAKGIIRGHDFSPHVVSRRITEAGALAERHLEDAAVDGLSDDAAHNLAYAAARVMAEALMLSEGYRPGHAIGGHAAVFAFLKVCAQGRWKKQALYFDMSRRKRNVAEYEMTGTIAHRDAAELLETATEFVQQVKTYLAAKA